MLRKIDRTPSFHEHGVSQDDTPFLDLVRSHTEAALENVLLYTPLSAFALDLEKTGAVRPADLAFANEGLARSEEELEKALAFREQVMGILGHDLRNPLSVVRMTAGLALRGEGLSEELRRALIRIDGAANRMVEMIGTLLDFTQSRFRGNLPVAPETMNLHDVCRGAIDELLATNPGRTIHFDVNGDGRGTWDPARIAQLVSNLVGNALVHGEKTEPVRVAVGDDERASVVLVVHNHGPAIAPDLIPVIFEPFRRGPAAEKTSRWGGLGLGLYIAQHIVRAHGGGITVESTHDAGTTFTVWLPREGPGAGEGNRTPDLARMKRPL